MPEIEHPQMTRFLDRVEQLKSEETHGLRKSGLRHFEAWLDDTGHSVEEVDALALENFLLSLSSDGYAPNSITSYFDSVRLFYAFLVDKTGTLEENPVDGVDVSELRSVMKGTKKHNAADISYVTREEVDALIEHASSPKLRNRLIIQLLFQTGCRRHELANIELEDLDRESRSITVWSEKTSSRRVVYYQPSLDLPLNDWLDGGYRDSYGPAPDSPYLFPSQRSEQLGADPIGKIVSRAAEQSGLQEVLYEDAAGNPKYRITAHTLRHGHAVHALKSDIDIRWVQEHLGHENIATTEKYLRVIDEDVKEAYHNFDA